ncbi:MAG TPA: FRG domain-containing protein [Bacteroidales bacterium]|nr:FRG domain-containing protein [Bacteroidales bacterium]
MLYFNTIEEKEEYYISGSSRIDDFENLVESVEKIHQKNSERALFRGQPDAKFMLYSSLQRLWIDKHLEKHYDSYRQLIDNLIQTCKEWNFGLVSKYLKNAGWEENEMSILSIMQHYGVPTPLLDFTYDINKSLFFATENIDFAPPENEIDRYFSIYYIFKNNSMLNIKDGVTGDLLSYGEDKNVIGKEDLDTTMKYDIIMIDNNDEAYRIQNNLNILNQEGAFIFNSSPSDPVEIHYHKWMKLFNRILEHKGEKNVKPGKVGGCLNINKKLAVRIKDYLRDKGIDRYSMFPDLNHMRTDCLNAEWQNITGKDT